MSSALGDDNARALASGRDSIGALLSTAQTELQKVFIVFVIGFIGTFYALRVAVWDWLKWVTVTNMDARVVERHEIIVTTPFEVILLQAKIGIMIGILISIPFLVWLSRSELKDRGRWPDLDISRGRMIGLGVISISLFVGGLVYAYYLFFPIMFDFLATQAINVGVEPTYGIVDWTEFLILLTISFGLAAQLPLAMTLFSYAGIISYETFRDKWKYAVLAIFAFGALFSPPDPFTQIMWAAPLIALYVFSLALAKLATNVRRAGVAGSDMGPGGGMKRLLLAALLLGVIAAVAGWYAIEDGILDTLYYDVRPALPGYIRPVEPIGAGELVATHGTLGSALLGIVVGVGVLGIIAVAYIIYILRRPVHPPLHPDDPTEVNLDLLNVDRIDALPADVFEAMDESDAVSYAQTALDDDNPEKAELIFRRFDAIDAEAEAAESAADPDEAEAGLLEDTATGVASAFSDERDKEDIGGYIHDIKFVVDSLKSRMLHMFIVFGIVLAGVFTFLYQGGLGYIKEDFISRMPDAVQPEEVAVIALHPVEVLIFIVKVSTIAAVLAVVPMILFYAWPAMAKLGWVADKRNVVIKWSVGSLIALAGGTMLGYFVIAPGLMSYLVYDALEAGMIISYRINSFAWLIIFTTVGIGLLALIPYTMWMFYIGGIATYAGMRDRWREVTIAAFAFAGMFTPASVLTMFIVGIPVMLFYWVGLAGLWVVTLGGRRGRRVTPKPA